MKIIDARKDYYDYLVGKYGIDPNIVLDRRDFKTPLYTTDKCKISIFFCGYWYDSYLCDGKYYWGEDLIQYSTSSDNYHLFRNPIINTVLINKERLSTVPYKEVDYRGIKYGKDPDCPIVLRQTGQLFKFPKLSSYGFSSIVSPEDAYNKLVDYCSKKDPISVELDDKTKIISHGFDPKASFRHRKK